jgi:hypothetical protein
MAMRDLERILLGRWVYCRNSREIPSPQAHTL